MQSPYDSALRVQRRTLDSIRLSLIQELASERAIEADIAALDERMLEEATVAAGNWQLMSHPYAQRQRDGRAHLAKDRASTDVSLTRLRVATMEACGQMQAIAEASAAFIADRHQRLARSEQAQADDFAGARISAHRRSLVFAGR